MSDDVAIEGNDLFVHKKRQDIAQVNFVSVDGGVSYRIKGARRCYFSKRANFLKNWRPLIQRHAPSGD